ncbi:DEHA2E05896p [Debaryomyces hansenii CBS767]|jgi:programmed cell death protein 5|uniref:DEHA2E05896p n=1 Tax=Debaryomyces hansenii (strain ATCC 36239 / CBS 767 / BCRC 21394 / JCM 1990 / NBRC 0083 / IGC 2968) TaxID=284592 RepID=Q6BQE1_DEBHA|nr:DEHA2E05896p [Debaryomyces hansenii CBS767]CAG87806.1 DEHA2E05896p [Debaryomyces hansenii CBS767]|eukprot:XP_459579.1 DEHA2E05896p [Debaryomyces hansenii CBS767]
MDDAELNAIRSARLSELQKNSGQAPADQGGDKKDDMKLSMLSQILETSARERLSRVRIVRPDRADAVEQYIIKLAATGNITRKLSENDIVEILDGISRDEKKQTQSKIVFDRRTTNIDSDEDDDFFD